MSFKQIAQLFDAPLAIVVGAVAAVLAAGQIGAMGLSEPPRAEREAPLDGTARMHRTAIINCLGVSGDAAHRACVRSQRTTMGLDAEAPAPRDTPRGTDVPAIPQSVHMAFR